MNFIVSFGIYSTPNLIKYAALISWTYKAIQWVPIDLYSSRFVINGQSFILGKIFFELTPLNLDSFSSFFFYFDIC